MEHFNKDVRSAREWLAASRFVPSALKCQVWKLSPVPRRCCSA